MPKDGAKKKTKLYIDEEKAACWGIFLKKIYRDQQVSPQDVYEGQISFNKQSKRFKMF